MMDGHLLGWGEVIAGLIAVLSFVVKATFSKMMRSFEKMDATLQSLEHSVVALKIKIEEIQQIKSDVREIIEKNAEAMIRIADLKKDVRIAHDSVREMKKRAL